VQGREVERGSVTLGKDDLEDIALLDVFLGLQYHLPIPAGRGNASQLKRIRVQRAPLIR
jgi:hypothetical protein